MLLLLLLLLLLGIGIFLQRGVPYHLDSMGFSKQWNAMRLL